MSSLKQKNTFNDVQISMAARQADWQIDRARNAARHVSGLVVQWQASPTGQPALDIGGLGKVKGTSWAGQIARLVDEAITLLKR